MSIKPFQPYRECLWGVVPMKEPAWRWGGSKIQSKKWLWGQQDLGGVRQTSFFQHFFSCFPYLLSFFLFILFKTKTPPKAFSFFFLWDPSNTPPKSWAIFKNDMQCILWRGHQEESLQLLISFVNLDKAGMKHTLSFTQTPRKVWALFPLAL